MRSSSRRQHQLVLAASAILVVACSSDASGPRSQAGEIAFALHSGLYSDIVLAADTGGELRHLTVEAHAAHRSAEDIVNGLLSRVRVPRGSGG